MLSAWDDLVSGAGSWGEADEVAEMFLFKLILAELDGDAQRATLLCRPEIAPDLVACKDEFLPVKEWDTVRNQLTNATNAKNTSRILWFLSAHPLVIPHDLLNTSIVPMLNHDHGIIRSLVLEITYGAEETSAINIVVQGRWAWGIRGCRGRRQVPGDREASRRAR